MGPTFNDWLQRAEKMAELEKARGQLFKVYVEARALGLGPSY